MSIVKDALRQIIAFSEQQKAIKQRKLVKDGKAQADVTVDAYATVIDSLSGILGDDDSEKDEQSDPKM